MRTKRRVKKNRMRMKMNENTSDAFKGTYTTTYSFIVAPYPVIVPSCRKLLAVLPKEKSFSAQQSSSEAESVWKCHIQKERDDTKMGWWISRSTQ